MEIQNNELRIQIPQNMEIDKENSTFECIKFKPVQNKRWSDENKKIIDDIIEYLECFNDYDCGDEPYEEYYERFEKYIKFMESLKQQSQWKPSEEQFTILLNAINGNYISDSNRQVLSELYRNLKKL